MASPMTSPPLCVTVTTIVIIDITIALHCKVKDYRLNLNQLFSCVFQVDRLERFIHLLYDTATLCYFLLVFGNHFMREGTLKTLYLCCFIQMIQDQVNHTLLSWLASESQFFRRSRYSVRLSRRPKKLITLILSRSLPSSRK